jgi:hypothetical protein
MAREDPQVGEHDFRQPVPERLRQVGHRRLHPRNVGVDEFVGRPLRGVDGNAKTLFLEAEDFAENEGLGQLRIGLDEKPDANLV